MNIPGIYILPVSLYLQYYHILNIPISEISEYIKICISQILKFSKNDFDICIIVGLFLSLHRKKLRYAGKERMLMPPSALFVLSERDSPVIRSATYPDTIELVLIFLSE